MVGGISSVIPLRDLIGGHRPEGEKAAAVRFGIRNALLDIQETVLRHYLVNIGSRIQMDAAESHPAKFQLRVFGQQCFCRHVPLPRVRQIRVLLKTLSRRSTRGPATRSAIVAEKGYAV